MVTVEINQIRAFLAVAEELHFGRAAEKIHMAQPPLSRAIQQLERELGTELFVRSTRRVSLSAAGAALVAPAADVLEAIRRGKAAVAATGKGEAGLVRMAFSGASTHVMVGRLAKAVRETHPGIDFQLDSAAYAYPALERVIRRETELGLGRWTFIPPEIGARVVSIEHLVIAVNRSHRLAERESLSFAELRDESFITLPSFPGSVLPNELHRLAAAAGFIPPVVQVAPDSLTVIALVGAGIGCTLTVSSVAEHVTNPEVRFVRVNDDHEPIRLRLAWRLDNENPAVREVLRISEEILPTAEDR